MANGGSERDSVAIVRLICQLILTLFLISMGFFIVIVRPEFSHAVSLGIGTLIGGWFGIVRSERFR